MTNTRNGNQSQSVRFYYLTCLGRIGGRFLLHSFFFVHSLFLLSYNTKKLLI